MSRHPDFDTSQPYAVLTGDVVKSRKLPDALRTNLGDRLREALTHVRAILPDEVPYEISVFRGDGWQFLVRSPEMALRAAVAFRAGLMRQSVPHQTKGRALIDSRVAIGFGSGGTVVSSAISESEGPAFEQSGLVLDGMNKSKHFLGLQLPDSPEMELCIALLDRLISGWTGKQAEVVSEALRLQTQEEIASDSSSSQNVVWEHLERAGFELVLESIRQFEAIYRKLAQ